MEFKKSSTNRYSGANHGYAERLDGPEFVPGFTFITEPYGSPRNLVNQSAIQT